jgi:hypothetical protein
MLPFAPNEFIALFGAYNDAVWPVQIIGHLLGIVMAGLVLRPSRLGSRIIGVGLALMWTWTGIAYHWLFFSPLNEAALLFGALFVLQGAGLFHAAALRGHLEFGTSRRPTAWLGWALVMYAAVLYPLLGMWTGHRYPEIPMFGITPCPVAIFTFGLLLLTTAPVSRWLLVIPLFWSLVGGSAAILLGITQDWLLLISAIAVLAIVLRDRNHAAARRPE